jgi:7,8-dihydropterin-6-yl-methyl-4-(beta-D-ribofuranosyl)aminobenzene 5'-phosphate synthase
MKITIAYDNEACREGLVADWGFSCLIQMGEDLNLLFDTGASGSILLHNMRSLGIDPLSIGIIVLSHPHWDHVGGLPHILEVNKDAEVYVPASFTKALPGRKVTRVKWEVQICQDVFSTGELKGIEQSLALNTGKGTLVVVGCSHPGVGSILDAASRWGEVYGIVGGLHGFHNLKRLQGLALVCPCHCAQYKSEIKSLFPQQCIDCGVGMVIEI